MISGCSELMTFSHPEKSFFEDNLLDADDWGKDVSLDGNHSPDSLSPLNVDQLQYIPDYSSNSLQYDCLDSFLGNSKFCLVENDIPEEQVAIVPISPISCNEKISVINNNSISISDTTLVSPPKQNINVPKIPINNIKSKVSVSSSNLNKTTLSIQNTLKMKNFKPICVKKEPGIPVMATPCSFPDVTPTIVKLDNGQFYVANSIKKPTLMMTNTHNQNSLKINMKRSPGIRAESIHTVSKDINDLRKYKREQRMVKNRESACLSRQRKKDHLKKLESCVTEISSMNKCLREENEMLKQKIQLLENENCILRKKCTDSLKDKVKKSSVLFGIFFIFVFKAIGSPPERKDIIESVPFQNEETIPYQNELLLSNKQLTFHSRSLLQFGNSNVKQDEYYLHLHQKPYNSNLMNDIFTGNIQKQKKMLRHKKKEKVWKIQNSREEQDSGDCGEQFNETYIKRINNALNGLVKGLRQENDKSKLLNGRHVDTIITNSSVTKMNKRSSDNCTHHKHHRRSTLFFKNYKLEKYRKNLPEKRDALLNLTSQELANVIKKSIDRKSDTFYVVTSWKDFLTILPSTNNSNFHRPKVSFMIPAFHPNNNGTFKDSNKLSMLKIDCNVIDTTLVKLDQNMVSKSLLTRL